MVNILMLSKWHVHAEEYANFANAQPDANVVAVWDEDPVRGAAWAQSLDADFVADFDEAINRADVDAVIVDGPTTDHRRVMVAAANAGKHIFTEKTLATTMDDARAIGDAIAANGVKFCISYPHLMNPLYRLCKQLIDAGELGRVHYMRFRNAHNGASAGWLPPHWFDMDAAGGGAMMDLGCHPMYVAPFLLGKPARVASIFNTTVAPAGDDNAVSVVEFENKAIAVLETSFVSPYDANCFELLGTEGAVTSIGGDIKIRTRGNNSEWRTPSPDTLPPKGPYPLRMFLDGILHNAPIEYDINMAYALTEMLEKAYQSHHTGKIATL
ncbi:MAG: Gfo/Idh/MocA family oxidoreductase [Defluviitaleaceae bacterium]|nr:Gfo/Idh/MocA family oxidoreductase [Defluviitaleaceae bacterium]